MDLIIVYLLREYFESVYFYGIVYICLFYNFYYVFECFVFEREREMVYDNGFELFFF